MHSKDMLSNKERDTTSWDDVVQLQGSSHDIQEWQEKNSMKSNTYYIYIIIHACIYSI